MNVQRNTPTTPSLSGLDTGLFVAFAERTLVEKLRRVRNFTVTRSRLPAPSVQADGRQVARK